MKLIPIKVVCHSGYKADEYPISFYWKDERFDISEVTDRWYQGDIDPDIPAADYFKVRTTNEEQFILKHEIPGDIWYLTVPGEY